MTCKIYASTPSRPLLTTGVAGISAAGTTQTSPMGTNNYILSQRSSKQYFGRGAIACVREGVAGRWIILQTRSASTPCCCATLRYVYRSVSAIEAVQGALPCYTRWYGASRLAACVYSSGYSPGPLTERWPAEAVAVS